MRPLCPFQVHRRLLQRRFHAIAVFASRLFTHDSKNLLQTLNLTLRFGQMFFETALQLFVQRSFCQLRKRNDELILRAVHVAQFIEQTSVSAIGTFLCHSVYVITAVKKWMGARIDLLISAGEQAG
jgi:hypothetical protein